MCLPHDSVLPATSDAVYSAKTRLPISSRHLIIEAYMITTLQGVSCMYLAHHELGSFFYYYYYMFKVCCRGTTTRCGLQNCCYSSATPAPQVVRFRQLLSDGLWRSASAVRDKRHAKNLILVQLKWEEEKGRNSSADIIEQSAPVPIVQEVQISIKSRMYEATISITRMWSCTS